MHTQQYIVTPTAPWPAVMFAGRMASPSVGAACNSYNVSGPCAQSRAADRCCLRRLACLSLDCWASNPHLLTASNAAMRKPGKPFTLPPTIAYQFLLCVPLCVISPVEEDTQSLKPAQF